MEGDRERGSEERGGSLRMAGATAYEGTARAEGADTVVGCRAEAARGGGNMAAGQSVSNRRAERSSYAESRARRHGDGVSAPLSYAPSSRGGGHAHPPSGYSGGRARHDVRCPRSRWVPWSTVSSTSSPSLSIPLVSSHAFTGGSSRRPTGNSRAKVGGRGRRESTPQPTPGREIGAGPSESASAF